MSQCRYLILITFLSALLFAGCNKEPEVPEPVKPSGPVPVTSFQAIKSEDATVFWMPESEIKVFSDSQSACFISQNKKPSHTASFSGKIYPDSTKAFIALYPYREDAFCDDGILTTTLPPEQSTAEAGIFIAKSKTTDLAFRNLCGGFSFSLVRDDIREIIIEGNGGETICGRIEIDVQQISVRKVLQASEALYLKAESGGCFLPDTTYKAMFLPEVLENGFKMTFNTGGQYAVKNFPSPIQITGGSIIAIENCDKDLSFKDCPAEAVDLGLSVKWANMNVGASKPEGFGLYLAWGELESKSSYNWSTYLHCSGSITKMTKYNTLPQYGTVDNLTCLQSEDDIAHVAWQDGNRWRIPTDDEWTELLEKCTWEPTTLNGVSGRKVISNVPGYTDKWIFLPAAGHIEESKYVNKGSNGYYWSSSLNPDYPSSAFRIEFYTTFLKKNNYSRYYGLSVRPVWSCTIVPTGISLDAVKLSLECGDTHTFRSTLTPAGCTDTAIAWASSDPSVAIVSNTGTVTALKAGEAEVTAKLVNGSAAATCSVTVFEQKADAVDLGLSVLWASRNIGADAPEDFGTFYTGKDDIASLKWSGGWRTPTIAQWRELEEKCERTWTVLNGVRGCRFTSRIAGYTDRSIFLPAAGFKYGASSFFRGSGGFYWSSDVVGEFWAGLAHFDCDGLYFEEELFEYLQNVRAVMQK